MQKGDGFSQNLLEKAYFIAKMSGPTMVRPASSDFWKAPIHCKFFFLFIEKSPPCDLQINAYK